LPTSVDLDYVFVGATHGDKHDKKYDERVDYFNPENNSWYTVETNPTVKEFVKNMMNVRKAFAAWLKKYGAEEINI
jgi:hypothetical protein